MCKRSADKVNDIQWKLEMTKEFYLNLCLYNSITGSFFLFNDKMLKEKKNVTIF